VVKAKDYGIMVLLAHSQTHPSGLIPFPFVLPLYPHCLSAFFFRFSFWKKFCGAQARQDGIRLEDWQKIQTDCIILKFNDYGT
jgi:hypothetical protein